MVAPRLLMIVPSFSQWDYVRATALSALRSPQAQVDVLIVDDASPDWDKTGEPVTSQLIALHPERVYAYHFPNNGGLTRSWNYGLQVALSREYDYACCGNSDLLFAQNWLVAALAALDSGFDLIGPVSNAPGTEPHQDVKNFIPDYLLSDRPGTIDQIGETLLRKHGRTATVATVNGFCMLAKTATWWAGAFDHDDVFRPRNDKNSRGQKNPTPLMTLNEYELQGRWKKLKRVVGFCPASFVFHYRSVSRGPAHKSPGWYRRSACPS